MAPPSSEWTGAAALRKKASTAQPKKLVIKGFKGALPVQYPDVGRSTLILAGLLRLVLQRSREFRTISRTQLGRNCKQLCMPSTRSVPPQSPSRSFTR